MEEEKINGFTQSEIVELYRFVCMYEKGGFCYFDTLEDVYKEHPLLREELPSLLGKVKLQVNSIGCIQNVNLAECKNNVSFSKIKKRGNLLSFLGHLRNSIAHGLIYKDGQQIRITDYSFIKPTHFSARGMMDCELFTQILNLIKTNVVEL